MSKNIIHRRDFLGTMGKVSLGTLTTVSLSLQKLDAQDKRKGGTWKPVSERKMRVGIVGTEGRREAQNPTVRLK